MKEERKKENKYNYPQFQDVDTELQKHGEM